MYLVPAFTGLGAPYWDMYARGCIVGLTRGVNRAHFARAVLESITYQMTDLLEAMISDSGIEMKDLRVDGGASVSNIMMQIQADMIQASVNRPKPLKPLLWAPRIWLGWLLAFGKTVTILSRTAR